MVITRLNWPAPLWQTFVNAMDVTSLAFIVPILLRGLRAQNYELVKKVRPAASVIAHLGVTGTSPALVYLFGPLSRANTACIDSCRRRRALEICAR